MHRPSPSLAHSPLPAVRLAALALLAAFVSACAGATAGSASSAPVTSPIATARPSPSASPSPFPLTMADDEGTSLTLPTLPRRIVSLTPGTNETLFALGVGSRVVGVVQDLTPYPPAVKQLPVVATYQGVDLEKVVGLRPDLVLAGGNGFNKRADIQKLRSLGIPVLVVYAKDVAGVLSDIDLVGRAVGEAGRAAQLTDALSAQMATIASAASTAGSKPRVFYEIDASDQIYGPAPDSFLAGMIAQAGGQAITTGDPSVFSIPLETLVAADPQVIVLGDYDYGTTPAQVAKRPGWEIMTAVRTGAIRAIHDTVVTRPGPRIADGLRDLALAIHPGLQLPSLAPVPAWTSPSP